MKKDTVVLISGCSSGIGLALAREFDRRGYYVFATARRASAVDIRSSRADISSLDVTNPKSIEMCVKHVMRQAGKIDILINNAGYALMGPVVDLSMDDFRRQFDTNVTGLVGLTQAVAPHMIKQHSGTIVNISSVSGFLTQPFSGAYCATKAAVNSLSDAMRMELEPFGIRVVTVQPGSIKSQFGETASKGLDRYERSVYAPVKEFIESRAMTSQKNPTTAEEFSKELITRLEGKKVPPVIRLGNDSLRAFLAKKLPLKTLDRMLSKRYGLDGLK